MFYYRRFCLTSWTMSLAPSNQHFKLRRAGWRWLGPKEPPAESCGNVDVPRFHVDDSRRFPSKNNTGRWAFESGHWASSAPVGPPRNRRRDQTGREERPVKARLARQQATVTYGTGQKGQISQSGKRKESNPVVMHSVNSGNSLSGPTVQSRHIGLQPPESRATLLFSLLVAKPDQRTRVESFLRTWINVCPLGCGPKGATGRAGIHHRDVVMWEPVGATGWLVRQRLAISPLPLSLYTTTGTT